MISLADREAGGPFDADDQRTLAVLIQEIGFAVANARLHARVSAHLAELEQSEKKYRTILHSIDYGYFEADLKGRLTFCDRMFLDILGISRQQAAAADACTLVQQSDASRVRSLAAGLLAGDRPTAAFETGLDTGGAQDRVAAVTLFQILDSQGRTSGLRGVVRDVTDQRRQALRQRQLELRLHKRQRLEVLGTLAGGVAHNFNNLLMGIQGNADLMRLQMTGESPLQRQVDKIQHLVSSGARMTGQMLSYARAGVYDPKPIPLASLVDTAMDTFRAAYKQIRFEKSIDAGQATVMADRGQMEQVLLNLLVNAVEAMPAGGRVTVAVTALDAAPDGPPGLPAEAPHWVRLTVTDTGLGMDARTLPRVFEPFFTTKDVGRVGRGLGLSTVHGIVADHQGHIAIDSTPGRGTAVTIHLPALVEAPTVIAAPVADAPRCSGCVLMVDDEPMVLEIGTLMLEALGYTVRPAPDAPAALQALEAGAGQIGLAVIDMIMPGMSGPELFVEIRRRQPSLPVLFTSGDQPGGELQGLLAAADTGFLQKPFRIGDLGRLAAALCGRQCAGAPEAEAGVSCPRRAVPASGPQPAASVP